MATSQIYLQPSLRNYNTETIAEFFSDVLNAGFIFFAGSSTFTNTLTNNKVYGISEGWAVYNSNASVVEFCFLSNMESKMVTGRINGDGTVPNLKYVTLTNA